MRSNTLLHNISVNSPEDQATQDTYRGGFGVGSEHGIDSVRDRRLSVFAAFAASSSSEPISRAVS